MSFPVTDILWLNTLEFIQTNLQLEANIIAPVEFSEKLKKVYDYSFSSSFNPEQVQWLIVHKGLISEINNDFLEEFTKIASPVFANEVFVIFSQSNLPQINSESIHLKVLWKQLNMVKQGKFKNNLKQKIKLLLQTLINLLKFINKGYKQEKFIGKPSIETKDNSRSQLNIETKKLIFESDTLILNIKTFGYEYARSLRDKLTTPDNLSPQKVNLKSKACQQQDIESDWFLYWCQQLKTPAIYHRKLWEFCYILQALYEYDLLTPGRKGLGFGCGEEPLPSLIASYDIAITATDLDPTASAAQDWIETNQSMSSLDKIWHPDLCTKDLFYKNVNLEYVDMNAIPSKLEEKYDFCWSACALEHLGSIKNGLQFIENSLNTLVPGGVCVHTTELNYLEEEKTLDNWITVLFRKRDFVELAQKLSAAGHEVAVLDFNIGSGVLDRFIDLPPYDSKIHQQGQEAHLKLLIDGFASTSFGIIVKKAQ
ncbi:MAG TPA: class I SAM-dependent methyltransferase [Nostocaceae cyanobacterium]|nr:class I SAM-dependent methyltransferase [Nostocaceae cyanobacterium]